MYPTLSLLLLSRLFLFASRPVIYTLLHSGSPFLFLFRHGTAVEKNERQNKIDSFEANKFVAFIFSKVPGGERERERRAAAVDVATCPPQAILIVFFSVGGRS